MSDKIEVTGHELVIVADIRDRIYTIRGAQVMLDLNIAQMYGVEVKRLNEQVRRNRERFPEEFCFQLTENEFINLKSQIVTSSDGEILKSQFATASWGGRRTMPYAFTEQGIAMLSSVLRSDTAVKVSIQIMKTFIAMRHIMASNTILFQRLDTLELRQLETDKKIDDVLNALDNENLKPKQGIFFDGQVFDAHKFCQVGRDSAPGCIPMSTPPRPHRRGFLRMSLIVTSPVR